MPLAVSTPFSSLLADQLSALVPSALLSSINEQSESEKQQALTKDQRFGTCRGETMIKTTAGPLNKARPDMVTAITAVPSIL